jgi:hypothetical protein
LYYVRVGFQDPNNHYYPPQPEHIYKKLANVEALLNDLDEGIRNSPHLFEMERTVPGVQRLATYRELESFGFDNAVDPSALDKLYVDLQARLDERYAVVGRIFVFLFVAHFLILEILANSLF